MLNLKNYTKNFEKNRCKYKKRHKQYIKKKIREYQSINRKLPDLKLIPDGYYCYDQITEKPCPFYERVEIKEEYPESFDHNPGLVAVGQTWIGKCNFLRITDNDLNGWGLLWDQCKNCGIKLQSKYGE